MKKLALWIWFTTAALMANPAIYAGLGDIIYDSVPNIEQLANVDAVSNHRQEIERYLERCAETKAAGYSLEKAPTDEKKQHDYLKALRALNSEYEFYVHTAHMALNQAMADKDYANFSELIKTGLIDIDKNGDQIVAFYKQNRGTEKLAEVEDYIQYQNKMQKLEKREQTKRHELYKSYKQRRIEQVRARQEAKKEAQRKEIDEEAEMKKAELKRIQQEELGQISK